MKKILFILTVLSLFIANITYAQFSILRGPQGGTGIGSATIGEIGTCLKVLSVSPLTYQLGTCGTGGGGSGGGSWSTTTSQTSGILINYPNNTTDVVVIGSTASTSAEVYFDPNNNRFQIGNINTASTTILGNVFFPTTSQGYGYIGSNGKLNTLSTSTLAGQVFPFTSVTGYNSTSTVLGLLNGLFSTASSTFSGNLFLPALSQGLVYRGSNGLLSSTATTTLSTSGSGISLSGTPVILGSTPLTISNTGVTSVIAGSGISVSGATGDVTISATGGGGTGNVATSTNETAGRLAMWTSTNGTPARLGDVATTSASCSGSVSCSAFTVIGASPITITGSGGTFPFTVNSWGNSTTSTLGLLNGFLSTASSTISITGNAPALSINSAQTTSQAFGAVELVNNSSSGIGLHITHTDASNSQGGVRLDSPAPEIEYVETDQVSPAGKFETRVNDDSWNVNGRNSGDTAFEEIFSIKRLASGGGVGLLDQTPDARLEVVATSTDRQRMFALTGSGGTDGLIFNAWSDGYTSIGWENPSVAKLQLNSNGTSPSAIDLTNTVAVGTGSGGANATNKFLGQFGWLSRDSSFTAPKLVAYIGAESTETYGADTDVGSDIVFYTGTQDGTNPTEKLRIKDTGNLQFNYSSSTIYSSFAKASSTQWLGGGLTSCSNATTDKILYNSTTGQFSCGTDQTSGGGSGITTLNGLTASTQSFATTSTTGGWGFNSSGSTHTLNIPTQNGSEVLGLISSTDWNTFNNKQSALTFIYPLVNSANSISLAFGTTTANSWSQVQTLSNGFLSQASSTIVGNATTTGSQYVGSFYGAGLTACNPTTEKLLWTATGQFTCGTDGGGGSASTTLLADTNTWSGWNNFTATTSIASSTPWARFSVDSSNLSPSIPYFAVGSSTGLTHLVVGNSGNVGVGGISNPQYALDVQGSGNVAQMRVKTRDSNTGLVIDSASSGDSAFYFAENGSFSWTFGNRGSASDDFVLHSGGSGFNSPLVFTILKTGNHLYNLGSAVIGTTTQTQVSPNRFRLTLATSTTPQLALFDQVGQNQWTFRNAGGNLYLSTSTSANDFATTTISALEIAGSGFGTTTLRGLNIQGQATSTSNVGLNITTGCFAVNGVCVGGGGGGSSASTTLLADTNYFSGINRFLYASSTYHSFDTASSTQWIGGGLQTCNATTGKLNWDSTTSQFRCDTDQTGGGGGTNYLTNSGSDTYLNTGTFLQAPALSATSTTATSTFYGNVYIGDGTNYGFVTGAQPLEIVGTNNLPYQSIIVNKSTGGNAMSGYTLGNVNSVNNSNPFLATYYSGTYMAGSGFNTYPGLLPNDTVVVSSDGNLRFASLSTNTASSSMTWSVGPGFTSSNYDMALTASSTIGRGFLGVGTSTPRFHLQVNATNSPQIALGGQDTDPAWTMRSIGGNFYLSSSSPTTFSTSTLSALTILNNGRVGVGTTTPNATLTVSPTSFPPITPVLLLGTTSLSSPNANGTYFSMNVPGSFSGNLIHIQRNGSDRLTLDAISGILTASTINGTQLNAGTSGLAAAILSTGVFSTNGSGFIEWSNGTNRGGTKDLAIYRNSPGILEVNTGTSGSLATLITRNIGIGTTTPGTSTPFALLQLSTSTANGGFRPQLAISDQAAGTNLKHWTISSQGGNLYFATSSDTYATSTQHALLLDSNGQVFMPSLAVNVTGNAVCFTTGKQITDAGASSCVPSSQRYKENIKTLSIDSAKNILKKLRFASFDYKKGFFSPEDSKTSYSPIAEEVEKIDKNLVDYSPDGKPQTLRWEAIMANIGVVTQDNANEIEKLKKENEELKKRLEKLEAKIK